MNEKLANEVMSRLDAVAAKFGVAAGQVWEILVRQAYIEGWMRLVLALAFSIVVLVAVVALHKTKRELLECDWQVAVTLVSVVLSVATTILVYRGCLFVWNPEYYAWREIALLMK